MKCLFLDIASHDGLLALVTEQEVIAHHAVHNRIPDHELIPLIEDLLRQGGWSYSHFTHVACVVGPGGFMSLRVASAFANTLASQLGIPSAGIHLSEVYGARVRDGFEGVYWVHSTKKEQLFVRGGQWSEPTLVTLQNFLTLAPRPIRTGSFGRATPALTGELIPEHEKALEEHGLKRTPLLDTVGILPAFLARQEYAKQVLTPWYGRGW